MNYPGAKDNMLRNYLVSALLVVVFRALPLVVLAIKSMKLRAKRAPRTTQQDIPLGLIPHGSTNESRLALAQTVFATNLTASTEMNDPTVDVNEHDSHVGTLSSSVTTMTLRCTSSLVLIFVTLTLVCGFVLQGRAPLCLRACCAVTRGHVPQAPPPAYSNAHHC